MPPLETKLQAIHQRMRWMVVARSVALGSSLGLGALAVVTGLRSTGYATTISPLMAGGMVAVGASVLSYAFAQKPKEVDAAILADRELGSKELFSSAATVRAREQGGVVASVLVDQAAVNAARLHPGTIVPVPYARLLAPPGIMALLAMVLTFALPPAVPIAPVQPSSQEAEIPAKLEHEEQVVLASDVKRLAEFIDSQARLRNDTYATAIARTLQDLSERLQTGDNMNRSDTAAELASLRDYAAEATKDWRGTSAERIPELLEALIERTELPPQLAMTPPQAPQTPEASNTTQSETRESSQPMSASSEPSADVPAGDNFASLMDDAEAAIARPSPSSSENNDGTPPPRVGDYLSVAQAQNEAEMALRASQMAENAELVGPSSDAKAGDSLLAGDGTSGVDGPFGEPLALEFETSGELQLASNDTGEGQRIEIDIAPPSQLTVVAEPSDPGLIENWARQPESSVARQVLRHAEREMVSRYIESLKVVADQ